MYSITTTSGFIIDARPYGEAGKLLSFFTHDFGLIIATAQGIRLEKSKLRYLTQLYSFGIFSFVRGKEFWRLTSVQHDHIAYNKNIDKKELIARLALLLRRLLHGEESYPELFDCILICFKFLDANYLTDKQAQTLESLTVVRILHKLGYIGEDAQLDEYIQSNDITIELLEKLYDKRAIINKHINKALKESHL
jgi:DNA repair protein RecO